MSVQKIIISILCVASMCRAEGKEQNVLMTEVFAIEVDPSLFNWTYEGTRDQFTYEVTLADAPDLPSWIHYVFSPRHHAGFLYGVPPSDSRGVTTLNVIGLNKRDYEIRVEDIKIIVQEKLNTAVYEVNLKIDNLNVEDMFEAERMEALKDIFKRHLWKDSEDDLYVTFLKGAVELGARKPLNPNEGEGVVLRLGSEVMFSSELLELQEEVRPLYKLQRCPRDFKRTSVERLFRDAGFALDWCSFRLMQKELGTTRDEANDELDDPWSFTPREEVPERSYKTALSVALIVPMIIMIGLVMVLSIIVCVDQEELPDEGSNLFFDNLFHLCTDWYSKRRPVFPDDYLVPPRQEQPASDRFVAATNHVDGFGTYSLDGEHSMSPDVMLLGPVFPDDYLVPPRQEQPASDRFVAATNHVDGFGTYSLDGEHSMSPDVMLLGRSYTGSPNSTVSRGVHCRPSPPPYVRPKFKPGGM